MYNLISTQSDINKPLIIPDYKKYAFTDYETDGNTMGGYRLGEVVYDQFGTVGVILAFYKGGEVRLNSNGVCDVDDLKKCPKNIAEKELSNMDILRPEKADKSMICDFYLYANRNEVIKLLASWYCKDNEEMTRTAIAMAAGSHVKYKSLKIRVYRRNEKGGKEFIFETHIN